MSSQWGRVFTKPAGAIPGGLFGQIVVALTTLLIAAFIIAYAIQGGSTEEERETTAESPCLPAKASSAASIRASSSSNGSNRPAELPRPVTACARKYNSPVRASRRAPAGLLRARLA